VGLDVAVDFTKHEVAVGAQHVGVGDERTDRGPDARPRQALRRREQEAHVEARKPLTAGRTSTAQVWLNTRAEGQPGVWVRSDEVVGARVRNLAPRETDEKFLLEVLAPSLSPSWLAVANGASEWFELNAAERLLSLLAEITRDESEQAPAVFVSIHGEKDTSLDVERRI
jgi:hypothetical protein